MKNQIQNPEFAPRGEIQSQNRLWRLRQKTGDRRIGRPRPGPLPTGSHGSHNSVGSLHPKRDETDGPAEILFSWISFIFCGILRILLGKKLSLGCVIDLSVSIGRTPESNVGDKARIDMGVRQP